MSLLLARLIRYGFASDAGFSVLGMLSLCTCLAAVCGIMSVVTVYEVQTTAEASAGEQADYLARSAALETLTAIEAGSTVPASRRMAISATQSVMVQTATTQSPNQISVTVTALVPSATDTVYFVYNLDKQALSRWVNNTSNEAL